MLAAEVIVGVDVHRGFEVVMGFFDCASMVRFGWCRVWLVTFEIDGDGADIAGRQSDANARGGRGEPHLVIVAGEDAVDHDDVQVNVEVEAAAEALDERDRGEFGIFERDGARPSAMTIAERAGERADDLREEVGVVSGAGAHVERKRQNPLAYWNARDDAVDDVRSRVAHATACAARTQATRLA